jgi:hypothetical protein
VVACTFHEFIIQSGNLTLKIARKIKYLIAYVVKICFCDHKGLLVNIFYQYFPEDFQPPDAHYQGICRLNDGRDK